MKVLIAYCSKTGSSKEVAKYISKQFEGSKLVNLSENSVELKNYSKIILGSGVYFGKIHKDLRNFISDNEQLLLKKKFAIYYTCGSKDEKKQTSVKHKNFSSDILNKAIKVAHVGGELNLNSGTLPVRTMIKFTNFLTTKIKKENPPHIDYKKVDDFVEMVKNITVE